MDQTKEFHNLDDPSDGLFRELGPGVTTRILSGEQAMLSVVSLAPNAQGILHHQENGGHNKYTHQPSHISFGKPGSLSYRV